MRRSSLTAAVFLALVTSAHGRTLYVANNGLDGPGCGPKASPCRSIGQAVNTNGADGDTIIVGPGRYGDLNGDGTLGSIAGEETGGFGCVLLVARQVTITSSNGAAATVIDGRSVSTSCNVGILVDGTRFGKPGKGFLVTNTDADVGDGIMVNASDVTISGNQVIAIPNGANTYFPGSGISTANAQQTILITANQVIGWGSGITFLGGGKTVQKNNVALCNTGLSGNGVVVGNVITGNGTGLQSVGTVMGNTFNGNRTGIFGGGGAQIEKNDFVGSSFCAIENRTGGAITVPKNYWGASTGPGPKPADATCDGPASGPTISTPFATKPFKVKAPFKP